MLSMTIQYSVQALDTKFTHRGGQDIKRRKNPDGVQKSNSIQSPRGKTCFSTFEISIHHDHRKPSKLFTTVLIKLAVGAGPSCMYAPMGIPPRPLPSQRSHLGTSVPPPQASFFTAARNRAQSPSPTREILQSSIQSQCWPWCTRAPRPGSPVAEGVGCASLLT